MTKFEEWMAKVDDVIAKKFFLTSRDLIDWDYYSAFEDGFTPAQAARAAIQNERDY